MIDSIKITLSDEVLRGRPDMDTSTMDLIENGYNHRENYTYATYQLDNFRVRVYKHQIVLIGSLSKFYASNMPHTLSDPEIKLAINELCRRTGLPLWRGEMQLIDIADNFIMEHPVQYYLDCCKDTPKYKRIDAYGSTLYYKKDGIDIRIYDKAKEVKEKSRGQISFDDDNVLRFELSINKRVNRRLKIKKAKVAMLLSTTIRDRLKLLWLKEFMAIHKQEALDFNELVEDVPDFKNQVIIQGVENLGGIHTVFNMIKRLKEKDVFNDKQAGGARRFIKRALSNSKALVKSGLMLELETKFAASIILNQ